MKRNDLFSSYFYPHTLYRYDTRNLLFLLLAYFVFFYTAIHILKSLQQIKRIILILSTAGFAFSVFSIVQTLSGTDRAYWIRKMPEGFFGSFFNPNNASNWLMMIFLLTLGHVVFIIKSRPYSNDFMDSDKSLKSRLDMEMLPLFILFLIVIFGGLAFSGSRGSLIITIFSSGFLIIISYSRRISIATAVSGIIILIVAAAVLTAIWMSKQPLYSDGDRVVGLSQFEFRTSIWRYTIKAMFDNERIPLFGTGLGTFKYSIQKALPWDYPLARKNIYLTSAHNEFLELVSDTGIIGAILFLSFIFLFLKRVIRIFVNRRYSAARSIGYSGFSVIIAIGLHSLIDFNLRIPANGFLFAGICAMMYFALHCRKDGSINLTKSEFKFGQTSSLISQLITISLTIFIMCIILFPLIAKQLDPIKKDDFTQLRKLKEMDIDRLTKRLNAAIRFDPLNGAHRFHLAKAHETEVRRLLDSPGGVVFDNILNDKISSVFDDYRRTLECQRNNGYYHLSLAFFAMLFVDSPEMSDNFRIPLFLQDSGSSNVQLDENNVFFNIAVSRLQDAVRIDPSNPVLHRGLYTACFYLAPREYRNGISGNAEKLLALGKEECKKFIEIMPVYYDEDGKKRASIEEALRNFAIYVSSDQDEMKTLIPNSRQELSPYIRKVRKDLGVE